jgi:hypothetical protein
VVRPFAGAVVVTESVVNALIMDGERGPSCGVRATGSPEKRIEKANDIKIVLKRTFLIL